MIDEVVKLVNRQPLGPHQKADQAGIEIAASRAHDQPGGRRQAHRGLEATAIADRRKARPGAEVGQDHPASGRLRPATLASSSIR